MNKDKLEMIRQLGWKTYLGMVFEDHQVKFFLALFAVVALLTVFRF